MQTTLTTKELTKSITVEPHPSLRELGSTIAAGPDQFGRLQWHASRLTRLELPGGRWVDYETAAEALADRDRLRGMVCACGTVQEAMTLLDKFFQDA